MDLLKSEIKNKGHYSADSTMLFYKAMVIDIIKNILEIRNHLNPKLKQL